MGLYSFDNSVNEGFTEEDVRALVELYTLEDLSKLPQDQIDQFLCSEECELLESSGSIARATIVKLNKMDDMARRIHLACLQVAKSKNDSLWKKFVEYKQKEKAARAQIQRKYFSIASKLAKVTQKEYLKTNKIVNSVSFSK